MLLNTANRTVWFSFVPQQSVKSRFHHQQHVYLPNRLKLYSRRRRISWYVSGIAHNGTGLFTSYINAGNSYMLDVDAPHQIKATACSIGYVLVSSPSMTISPMPLLLLFKPITPDFTV